MNSAEAGVSGRVTEDEGTMVSGLPTTVQGTLQAETEYKGMGSVYLLEKVISLGAQQILWSNAMPATDVILYER